MKPLTLAEPRAIKVLTRGLITWFSENARDLPWRRTRDPYAVWVSEIMLQQTQVKTVIPYYERWMKALPTLQSLRRASSQRLLKLWEGLGYYTRVRNLHKAAQIICKDHDGRFPTEFEKVLSLPGIGRYTAGAICSIAFNQPTPILDGNVIRVLTRFFGIITNPKERQTNDHLWRLAGALVVHASRLTSHALACSHFNQSLMELGATICTPRSPHCGICPVRTPCKARRNGTQETLPNLGQRVKSVERRFVAFVVKRNGKFLVRQRPAGNVNAHLWEFPNALTQSASKAAAHTTAHLLGLMITGREPLCIIKHSITRYQITLATWSADLLVPQAAHDNKWLTRQQLHRLAFTSAHKRILNKVAGWQPVAPERSPSARSAGSETEEPAQPE